MKENRIKTSLTNEELTSAQEFWVRRSQSESFATEIVNIKKGKLAGKLAQYHPFLDNKGILRVGGRTAQAEMNFSVQHPIILHGKHPLVRLLIKSEHERLLHAGLTLTLASLHRRYCVLKGRSVARAIIRNCVRCKKIMSKPNTQVLGQLPADRLKPGIVFENVGVDYAGPVLVKSGRIRKPTITKAYIAIFVSFSVKAVHIEPVSDLTTESFIATLRRFIARRGKPTIIWSDHGTNFVGAARELKELYEFLKDNDHQEAITNYCSLQNIRWKFTPEHAPHFGGLWEAAVKSFKGHFRKIVGEVRLTFEELSTVACQIEACMNSRPLTQLPEPSDGLEVLTPGHFLIGRPIEALPEAPVQDLKAIPVLRRWQLCQALVSHWWKRWTNEYLSQLSKFAKWSTETPNIKEGDIVCVRNEPTAPTKWPLARIIEVHPGRDGKVRVVTLRTDKGVYKRPIVNIVPLIQSNEGGT